MPIRLEVGPRDVKAEQAVLVRRDTGEKVSMTVVRSFVVVRVDKFPGYLKLDGEKGIGERVLRMECFHSRDRQPYWSSETTGKI